MYFLLYDKWKIPVPAIAPRLSSAQAASGLMTGISTPFFGVWLAWRGFSAGQITLILSTGLVLRILAGPVTGIIADARNDRRAVMLYLYWAIAIGYGVLSLSGMLDIAASTAIAVLVASGVVVPLLESVSIRLAEQNGHHYGKIRLWASAAFILANVLGGAFVWRLGPGMAAPLLGLSALFCVISTLRLPAPVGLPPDDSFYHGLKRTCRETGELLRSGPFLLLLLTGSLAQGSHAFYYNFGGLHWHELGYSGLLIGMIWPLGVFAEITILRFAHRIITVLGPAQLLFWGGATCVLRWTVLAFDPPLTVVIAVQFLHGITFAFSHLGAMFFIQRAIPARLSATAQSLYFVSYSGLMLGVATYVSGMIYAAHGGQAYFLMSAMGGAAMASALVLNRVWQGGRLIATEVADPVAAN
ncbi:MAG: MFS transporter [Rhizomicrobium sp.]